MASARLIWVLAQKDWQLFWADRRAAILCFAVPIMLASGFGLVFHSNPAEQATPKLPLAIVAAPDPGPFTQQVLNRLKTGDRVDAIFVSAAEAARRVQDRRPGVSVEFPQNFEQLAAWQPGTKGEAPRVIVRYNPLASTEAQWAEGVISEAVMKTLADTKLAPFLALSGQQQTELPFQVQTVSSMSEHERSFNAYTHSFSGMTLQYLLFWGMESGLLLLRERRRSLWLRLRAAPVPLGAMLCGKALATATIALLQVIVTFTFGAIVFGVRIEGSHAGFLLIALGAGALSAVTGLLVAAIGGTEARARSMCILAILSVSMLGGLWLPSFVLPGWARDLALCLPTTWAMRGLDAVTWQGRGFVDILPHLGVLLSFTGLFLAIAVAKFVTSEQSRRCGGSTAC